MDKWAHTSVFKICISIFMSSVPFILAVVYFIHPSIYALANDKYVFRETGRLVAATGSFKTKQFEYMGITKKGIPVLVYHFIKDAPGEYNINKKTFIEHLKLLKHLNYKTITAEELHDFLVKRKRLPDNPILITFDDGARNTYIGADETLRLFDMKATIFVITSRASTFGSSHLNWRELRLMKDSGRWDIQSHSFSGHHEIQYDKHGNSASFFGSFQYLPDKQRKESIAEYKKRVDDDLARSVRDIEENIPGQKVIAFAYPFSDYGGNQPDKKLQNILTEIVGDRFLMGFRQSDDFLNNSSNDILHLSRLSIEGSPSAEWLYEQLKKQYE